jgi:hypothetical protein
MYGQTEAGERFAGKRKRARQRAAGREGELGLGVVAGTPSAVLEWGRVAEVVLAVEGQNGAGSQDSETDSRMPSRFSSGTLSVSNAFTPFRTAGPEPRGGRFRSSN